ncbi:MAG: CapA family protein [Agathobacter sp.]|nr:CapA family protein [Agathobacter sp.]
MRKKLGCAGIVMVFFLVLVIIGKHHQTLEPGASEVSKNQETDLGKDGQTEANMQLDKDRQESDSGQISNEKQDLEQIQKDVHNILENGSNNFFAGYSVNDSFLLWVADTYGEDTLSTLVSKIENRTINKDSWYEVTGNSIHVLWLQYGRAMQFASYKWQDVKWIECQEDDVIRIDFTGDINLDENWYTMETLNEHSGEILECIDGNIQQELQDVDISVINNEFSFSERGEALEGKAYTFRANPDKVSLLEAFGADIASLGNNHVYDYGAEALLDTITTLENAGISTIGAGENIKEAKQAQYVVANGRKIGFVSATEIEKYYKYTKEATETEPGVLKTLDPETFLSVIREVDSQCDYVIVYVHWGIEGWNQYSVGQVELAKLFAEAGADVIIGGHPHRLQGVQYLENVPVAYSLGNFWFSTGTLYTTIAQVEIQTSGTISLRMIPCIQQNVTTRMLTDETEVAEFYKYLADISKDIAIDAQGKIYDSTTLSMDQAGLESFFFSGQKYGQWEDDRDLEGYAIDIVGNRTS